MESHIMKKVTTIVASLMIVSGLGAMQTNQVLLNVTNDGMEPAFVQIYEYKSGGFFGLGGGYHELSTVYRIDPDDTRGIEIDKAAESARYLYYHYTEPVDPAQVRTRVELPHSIDQEYDVEIKGISPGDTAPLRVTNTGQLPVYVQVYDYLYGRIRGEYKEQSASIMVEPGHTEVIMIPKVASLPQRYLYYAQSKVMGFNNWIDLPVVLDDEGLAVDVALARPIGEQAAAYIKEYNEKHPEKVDLSWVRNGAPELPFHEQTFLKNRAKITRPAITNILREQGYNDTQAWKMPRVALCTSGGGFRAMLSSLGFIQAMSESGVLDVTTYGAALSGSTWMWMKWLHDGATSEMLPEVVAGIREALNKGLLAPEILYQSLVQKLLFIAKHKLIQSQIPISDEFKARFFAESNEADPAFVNLYGMLLADALFANDPDRYSVTLSSFADRAVAATMPLPLCTAIATRDKGYLAKVFSHGKEKVQPIDYSWFEFTPFSASILESSMTSGNGAIPMWGLGRRYEKGYLGGVSSVKDPVNSFNSVVSNYLDKDTQYYGIEPGLNQLVAAFGSAFTVDTAELTAKSQGIPFLEKLERTRLFYGLSVPNFYNPETETKDLGLGNTVQVNTNPFELRDGGISFNLPLPPLFNPHRDIAVLIIMDASGDLNENLGGALKEFVMYAKHHNVKIPDTLEREESLQRALEEMKEYGRKVRVFGDWNKKDEMTVIYIPTIIDPELPLEVRDTDPMKFSTFKLHYAPEESQELVSYARALGNAHADYIKKIVGLKAASLNEAYR